MGREEIGELRQAASYTWKEVDPSIFGTLFARRLADVKYAANADRVKNRVPLLEKLSERFRARGSASWIAELDREGIPAGPINDLDGVFNDPQVSARDLLVDYSKQGERSARLVKSPVRMSRTTAEHKVPPPRLGEHTDEILAKRAENAAG